MTRPSALAGCRSSPGLQPLCTRRPALDLDQGWQQLRDARQEHRPDLAGDRDVVISAATAGGKTEAAFLPICSALLAHDPGVPATASSALRQPPQGAHQRPVPAPRAICEQPSGIPVTAGTAMWTGHRRKVHPKNPAAFSSSRPSRWKPFSSAWTAGPPPVRRLSLRRRRRAPLLPRHRARRAAPVAPPPGRTRHPPTRAPDRPLRHSWRSRPSPRIPPPKEGRRCSSNPFTRRQPTVGSRCAATAAAPAPLPRRSPGRRSQSSRRKRGN